MFRLVKYLKPYLLLILISIGLLFGQAMADLALPNHMSEIVNIGIQQGGVENAVPQAIRASEMDKLVIFMSAENKTTVLTDYTLIDSNSVDYQNYLKKYPVLANEPVYVLNQIDIIKIQKLAPITGKAILVVSMLEQAVKDPAKAALLGQSSGFDISKLPAGMDVFALLSKLPADQISKMTASVNEKFSAMSSSMIAQSAAAPIKAEYEALGMDAGKIQTAYILRLGGWMLLLTLLSATATIIVGFLSARTAAGVSRDLRRAVFGKVESFSKAEFEKFSTASLITRSTNDVTQIQMVIIMIIRMVFYAPIIGVGAIIRAVHKSPSMTWIIALAVALLLVLIVMVFSVSLPKFKRIQSLIDRLNLVTRESLSGMMVIRAFNTQAFEAERFDKANKDLTANNLFVSRVMVVMMPMMMLLMNGLSVLIIWVGAHQVAASALQVGDMMAFMQYAMQVVFSFLMLSLMFIILPRAVVSGGRIADVLAIEPTIVDPKEPKQFDTKTNGLVEFRNVSFRYPDAEENVLCGINFTAKPGETTAIIGSTGSGKSTVVNLIPRFFDVTEGAIFVDGVDIREVNQSDLREKIGYIPQKGMLFSGTIESNLRYADEGASLESLNKAVEIAQANEFISTKENGLQSEISQGGVNVSGGQKQRLAIARALVKQPPIYIFDDCLSALDFKTDSALRHALKKETGKSAMIIVTQRVSTIKTAEQIVVLDEGEIVGKGTHRELMKNCETYREIALSQLSKEELA
ncbi:MAG: ABC-type multidrug transport system ATPase and permease component [Chloroflexi bacterium]|nr:MAG: ABC-type multidrug transport system ATPase and permease component [Chloroflexota bacterium]